MAWVLNLGDMNKVPSEHAGRHHSLRSRCIRNAALVLLSRSRVRAKMSMGSSSGTWFGLGLLGALDLNSGKLAAVNVA